MFRVLTGLLVASNHPNHITFILRSSSEVSETRIMSCVVSKLYIVHQFIRLSVMAY